LVNVGIDMDGAVVRRWQLNPPAGVPNLTVLQCDAVQWLREHAHELDETALVYADPPYLMSTRSSQRMFYNVEMAEEKQHRELIEVLRSLKCMVMLSGYWSQLYADLLGDWRTVTFKAMTRGGTMATEWLWMNYPQPVELHDYRYLGETFRQREQLKRMKRRWVERLQGMPVLKRQALLMAVQDLTGAAGSGESGDNTSLSDARRQGTTDEAMLQHGGSDDADMELFPSGTIWRNVDGEFEMPLDEYMKEQGL
jgi:hypothetical protein